MREAEQEKKEEERARWQEYLDCVAKYMGAEAECVMMTPTEQMEGILSPFDVHRESKSWSVLKMKRDGHVIQMKPAAPNDRVFRYAWFVDDKPLCFIDCSARPGDAAKDQVQAKKVYEARLLMNEVELVMLAALSLLAQQPGLLHWLMEDLPPESKKEARENALIERLKGAVNESPVAEFAPLRAETQTVYYFES